MELSRRETALLRALTTRSGRKKLALCRCEGVRAVRELCRFYPDLVELVAATPRGAADLALDWPDLRQVSEKEFQELAGTVNSQGVIALAQLPSPGSGPPQVPFILALDQLGDPGNFGTIARGCRAAGVLELWYTKGSVDPWSDKAVRSGMGAQFGLKLRKFADARELITAAAEYGYGKVFYADPHGGASCFTAPGLFERSVVFIGGEPNGSEFPAGMVQSVNIPMPGNYESINAAQAATVLLFESVRRRTTKVN